jgi:hypothetical protein
MDLFSQIANATAAATVAASNTQVNTQPVTAPAPVQQELIITVAIEKIKKRTVTVVYNMDITLDPGVRTPEELLSKLKKKICYSNGFIRKPEDKSVAESESESSSGEDEGSDSEGSESSEGSEAGAHTRKSKPVSKKEKTAAPAANQQTGLAYVINGNHSNVICRYIYSLGVKQIIRTGTA